jgi:hypothetical protein
LKHLSHALAKGVSWGFALGYELHVKAKRLRPIEVSEYNEIMVMEHKVPGKMWGWLAAVAFGGSAFFGASLAHTLPGWDLLRGAAWLTFSAGTGWLLLGPALIWLTKLPIREVAHACLVAMAVGEAVLAVGATINFLVPRGELAPVPFNAVVVGISNVAMAAAMVVQLRRRGASPGLVLAAWLLVLDGGGAIAFWAFHRLLFGGSA